MFCFKSISYSFLHINNEQDYKIYSNNLNEIIIQRYFQIENLLEINKIQNYFVNNYELYFNNYLNIQRYYNLYKDCRDRVYGIILDIGLNSSIWLIGRHISYDLGDLLITRNKNNNFYISSQFENNSINNNNNNNNNSPLQTTTTTTTITDVIPIDYFHLISIELFQRLENIITTTKEYFRLDYSVKIKCYEVYAEQIRDLLSSNENMNTPYIRENKSVPYIESLVEKNCLNSNELYETIRSAYLKRLTLILEYLGLQKGLTIPIIDRKFVGYVGNVFIQIEVSQTLCSTSSQEHLDTHIIQRTGIIQYNILADSEALSYKPLSKSEIFNIVPLYQYWSVDDQQSINNSNSLTNNNNNNNSNNSNSNINPSTLNNTQKLITQQLSLSAKALSTLSRVISALYNRQNQQSSLSTSSTEKNYHISYRDSILTRVLQSSLEGYTANYICLFHDLRKDSSSTDFLVSPAVSCGNFLRMMTELQGSVKTSGFIRSSDIQISISKNKLQKSMERINKQINRKIKNDNNSNNNNNNNNDNVVSKNEIIMIGENNTNSSSNNIQDSISDSISNLNIIENNLQNKNELIDTQKSISNLFWSLLSTLRNDSTVSSIISSLINLEEERELLMRKFDGRFIQPEINESISLTNNNNNTNNTVLNEDSNLPLNSIQYQTQNGNQDDINIINSDLLMNENIKDNQSSISQSTDLNSDSDLRSTTPQYLPPLLNKSNSIENIGKSTLSPEKLINRSSSKVSSPPSIISPPSSSRSTRSTNKVQKTGRSYNYSTSSNPISPSSPPSSSQKKRIENNKLTPISNSNSPQKSTENKRNILRAQSKDSVSSPPRDSSKLSRPSLESLQKSPKKSELSPRINNVIETNIQKLESKILVQSLATSPTEFGGYRQHIVSIDPISPPQPPQPVELFISSKDHLTNSPRKILLTSHSFSSSSSSPTSLSSPSSNSKLSLNLAITHNNDIFLNNNSNNINNNNNNIHNEITNSSLLSPSNSSSSLLSSTSPLKSGRKNIEKNITLPKVKYSSKDIEIEDMNMSTSGMIGTDLHLTELERQFLKAISYSNLQQVQECLHQGVNIKVQNSFGRDGTQIATRNGSLNILILLYQAGASLSTISKSGDTLYHIATHYGHLELLQWLIENNCAHLSYHQRNNLGQTCVHIATQRAEYEILLYLFRELEMNMYDVDLNFNTPYDLLLQKKNTIQLLGREEEYQRIKEFYEVLNANEK